MIEVIDMTRTSNPDCPPIEVIDISHLRYVTGGINVDKQTAAAQAVLAQAVSTVKQLADSLAPKTGIADVLLQVLSSRRSNSGPGSAPALPPTSTLTR